MQTFIKAATARCFPSLQLNGLSLMNASNDEGYDSVVTAVTTLP